MGKHTFFSREDGIKYLCSAKVGNNDFKKKDLAPPSTIYKMTGP